MRAYLWNPRKVTIVGAGAVGSTFAYALAQSGLADEIVLVDVNRELARGQALDLAHGMPFYPNVAIRDGQAEDYADARVIVVTAGAKQRPGESRLDLLQRNARIVEQIVDDIVARNSQAVLVMVANPVDVLTHVAFRRAGWPRNRVLGSGTVLDSARFRYLLSQHCGVGVHNVHAHILGEHGDSEFAAWSMANLAGLSMDAYCPACGRCADWKSTRAEIVEQVRTSAYHIIGYKGATDFGIGMALVQIVRAILRNERRVLTVSTVLAGEYGLSGVSLAVPCVVADSGVERVLTADLTPDEQASLEHSASVLREALAACGS